MRKTNTLTWRLTSSVDKCVNAVLRHLSADYDYLFLFSGVLCPSANVRWQACTKERKVFKRRRKEMERKQKRKEGMDREGGRGWWCKKEKKPQPSDGRQKRKIKNKKKSNLTFLGYVCTRFDARVELSVSPYLFISRTRRPCAPLSNLKKRLSNFYKCGENNTDTHKHAYIDAFFKLESQKREWKQWKRGDDEE